MWKRWGKGSENLESVVMRKGERKDETEDSGEGKEETEDSGERKKGNIGGNPL